MKSILHTFLFGSFFLLSLSSRAQITRLSNNTNVETAVPLSNVAILITKADSLYRTDATPGGTYKLSSTVSIGDHSPFFPSLEYVVYKNKMYFNGTDAANGTELWETDGTPAGTKLVLDINTAPGGSSSPSEFMILNNTLFFFANNGTTGKELWKSDGTGGGTELVKDIFPGPLGSITTTTHSFVKGTELFFTATNGTNGVELWKTNGSGNGTVLVKDINPGPASSNPSFFYQYGSIFLFSADDGTTGTELWKTDGSDIGTKLVKDIAEGAEEIGPDMTLPNSSNPFGFTLFKNKVYFTADNPLIGTEGWVTDGTPEGTSLLKDINTAVTSTIPQDGFPFFLNALFINNQMIFPATSKEEGAELFQSDGTQANTGLFKDINPGTPGSNAFFFLNFYNVTDEAGYHTKLLNGSMFMMAKTPGAGTELWKTNGTSGTTSLVKDINPGPDSSMGGNSFTYFYTPNYLYFSATDGQKGYELWRTDGSEGNTTRVIDIFPGDSSSNPNFIGYFNGTALFTANDGDNNVGATDLFRLDGTFTPMPLTLLEFAGTQNEKDVRLNWTTVSEQNTAYFDVERSNNGSQFEAIGKLKAAGNSSDKRNYQFTDASALATNNKVFYRLKMVDEDGKFTYSKIIAFNNVAEGRLLTYPNPAKDELKVTINSGNRKQLSIRIFDQGGKQVYNQQLGAAKGNNNYVINVSAFAKGSYYLNIVTDDGVETTKFIKN